MNDHDSFDPESLSEASPAVWALLKRKLSESELTQAALLFSAAVKNGRFENQLVTRSSTDIRFNPWPARVLSLLANECRLDTAKAVHAALLTFCADVTDPQFIVEEGARAIAADALRSTPESYEGRCIALAKRIDWLRHHHQMPALRPEECADLAQTTADLARLVQQQLPRVAAIALQAAERALQSMAARGAAGTEHRV